MEIGLKSFSEESIRKFGKVLPLPFDPDCTEETLDLICNECGRRYGHHLFMTCPE
jgi:hypothetical protein